MRDIAKHKSRAHLYLLLDWPAYLILYAITENCIPYDRCYVSHIGLDDLIPFQEWFVIPYCIWYFLVFGSLAYFLVRDKDRFCALQVYILYTQVVAMTVYILFPSIQLLRPDPLPRDNLLTRLVGLLYRIDTPTGVLPSLHVAYAVAVGSVWQRDTKAPRWWKVTVWILVVLICQSTMSIKQHSALDVIWALVMCLVWEIAAACYRRYRRA